MSHWFGRRIHVSTPGEAYKPGYYTESVMRDLREDTHLRHLSEEAQHARQRGQFIPMTQHRTRKYDPTARCPVCAERPVQVRGVCKRCYLQEYRES